jgi:membrane protease subunit HflK
MPWNNQSGGSGGNGPSGNGSGGGNGGPWSRGPSGGGNGGPPDLEEVLRRSQDRLRRFLPSRGFSGGTLLVVLLIALIVWLLSGIYFVGPSEQGIVLRFGAYMKRTTSGMNYHLPWPIETAYSINVTSQRQITIGYRTEENADENHPVGDNPTEADMLTGDENIIDINFTVGWVIHDAGAYLFNVEDPEGTVRAVAESAMREVVGRSQFESILTQEREHIQMEVRALIQKTLDEYGAGITIMTVSLQKADPPGDVLAAYRDVQKARADQERLRNEAEAYANNVIPKARGTAAKIVQDAEAYRQQVIAEASGQARRFLAVLAQYRTAPDVTRRRIYLDTMASILKDMNKVVVDDSAKGVVPYFQLPAMLGNGGNTAGASNSQNGGQP